MPPSQKKRPLSAWNVLVKKTFADGRAKDKSYTFTQALQDASKLKDKGTASARKSHKGGFDPDAPTSPMNTPATPPTDTVTADVVSAPAAADATAPPSAASSDMVADATINDDANAPMQQGGRRRRRAGRGGKGKRKGSHSRSRSRSRAHTRRRSCGGSRRHKSMRRHKR